MSRYSSNVINLVFVLRTIVIRAATLLNWKTRVLVVSKEDEGEVNVHDDNDWSDNEKYLHCTTWKGWALVKVGFTVILLIFVSVVAFLLRFLVFLVSSHG